MPTSSRIVRDADVMAIDGVDRSKDVHHNLPLVSAALENDDPLLHQLSAIEDAVQDYLDEANIDWSMVDVCHRCSPNVKYPENLPPPVILVMATPRDEHWPEVKRGLEVLSAVEFGGISIELSESRIVEQ